MDFLLEYVTFFSKTITIVISFLICLLFSVAIIGKGSKSKQRGKLKVSNLNDKYKEMSKLLEVEALSKKEIKIKLKEEKKLKKKESKTKNIFVLDFKGDMKATGVDKLRDEVTAVLNVATTTDEVVVKVESPGGVVHGYGLAATQLGRFRDKQIPLTISVDKVAASGGYLMATTANQIIAAPFAIVGSIGVISQIPNFNKFLTKHDIDFEEHTAGDYKRTISMFGKITDKGREKFKESLEEIHHLFKEYITHYRPTVNIEEIATGEHWLAKKAIELNLVDKLITSDDYLFSQRNHARIIEVSYESKKTLVDKLIGNVNAIKKHFSVSV